MSVLLGLQILKKRRASVAGALATEGLRIGAAGVVHSIASAIQNVDNIKRERATRSAFAKVERMAMSYTANRKREELSLSQEETSIFQNIAEVAKEGVSQVVGMFSGHIFRVFGQAVRLACIPVFSIFCSAVTAVFRTILLNPYGLAATALITAALGARRAVLNYRESEYRADSSARGKDLPAIGSSGPSAPPLNDKNRRVQEIVAEAAKRNGVPVDLALRVAQIESSMNPDAGSKSSSAKGLFGIISSTWVSLGGKPGEENDPYKNADLGTKYLKMNSDSLKRRLGRDVGADEVYASHFFGPGVAPMLAAKDKIGSKSIEEGMKLFSSDAHIKKVMSQNPHLRGKTVSQVMDMFRAKVGGMALEKSKEMDSFHESRIKGGATGSFALPSSGAFTSPFGPRTFRGPGGVSVSNDHKGIDIANSIGTPIYAADSGVVTVASVTSAGYGTRIDIDHGNGFLTRYGHSSKLFVKEGDRVGRGQHIAAMGNSGFSSGPHLHFEVRTVTASGSTPVDPAAYLPLPAVRASISTDQVARSAASVENQYVKVGSKIAIVKGG